MTVFMALILVVVMIMPVYADEISEQQDLLEQINQQMDQQQNNLNSAAKTEKTIMGQVQGIEQETARTEREISKLWTIRSAICRIISRLTEKQIKPCRRNWTSRPRCWATVWWLSMNRGTVPTWRCCWEPMTLRILLPASKC